MAGDERKAAPDSAELEHVIPSISEAADRLEQHLGIRSLPRPPGYLLRNYRDAWLTGSLAPTRTQPIEPFPKFIDGRLHPVLEYVAPHWNEAVRMLNSGGEWLGVSEYGYSSLVQMRDRLQDHLKKADAESAPLEAQSVLLERSRWAFWREFDEYGPDAKVAATLGDEPAQRDGSVWRWVKEDPWMYVLHLDEGDDEEHHDVFWNHFLELWKKYGRSIMTFRKAFVNDTWRDAVHRAEGGFEDAEERLAPLNRLRSVLRFRKGVIEQVLKEHEILGYVEELRPGVQRPLQPPDISHYHPDQLLFIVLAHEAVMGDPHQRLHRSTLLMGKKGEIGGVDARVMQLLEERPEDFGPVDIEWYGVKTGSNSKAMRLAASRPIKAYWATSEVPEDEDGIPEGEDPCTRAYFDRRIKALYEEICAAGVCTVDHVADCIHRR